MVRLLTQGLCKPYPVPDQVVSLFAGGGGFLDDLAVEEVVPFERGLIEYAHKEYAPFMKTLEAGKSLPAELSAELAKIVKRSKEEVFVPRRKTAAAQGEATQPAPAAPAARGKKE